MVERRKPPTWMREVVAEGLMSFVVLGLPGQPPAETIALTGEVWIKALWRHSASWDEDQDRIRIEEAFVTLLPLLDKWPPPKELLAALPPLPTPKRLLLPAPEITEEQRIFNLGMLRKIKRQIFGLEGKMRMPQEPKPKEVQSKELQAIESALAEIDKQKEKA